MAPAGGPRDLLGRAGPEEGGGEPDQGQGGRFNHAAPGHLSVHATELPARAAGENPFAKAFEFGPNLDIIPKVNLAYEQAAQEDEKNRDHILKAHRNFLRDAIYFLYVYNRVADAAQWFKYLATKYPDKPILDNDTNSFPANLTLDQYAVARVQGDISETAGMIARRG